MSGGSLTHKLLRAHLVAGELAPGSDMTADAVTARVDDGREIRLDLPLRPGERDVLAAGGLLAHVRAGGRQRVAAADLTPAP
jgi:hypothetical protein